MAFCPGCGYEFREGLRRCPDCDMDLVASLEDADGGHARLRGRTVSIFSSTRAAVEMLADMLSQEGIENVVKPATTPAPVDAATVMESAPAAELHVAAQDAEEQRGLIDELIAELADGGATGKDSA